MEVFVDLHSSYERFLKGFIERHITCGVCGFMWVLWRAVQVSRGHVKYDIKKGLWEL